MLIVKLTAAANGALANQTVFPALPKVPEGWVQIPEALEEKAQRLLPWMTLEMSGGAVVDVGDNSEARAAAAAAAAEAAETEENSGAEEI